MSLIPTKRERIDPKIRKDQILQSAIKLAMVHGYTNVTREKIAIDVGVSNSLITSYFNTMTQLRRTVMRYAINQKIPEIIAQGLANKDPHAKKAPADLKNKAIKIISNY